jgi:4-hydroxy 2-oxovalerate aldolase
MSWLKMNNEPLKILDCTLRDGGYYNAWDFSVGLINDYLQAMSALSVDYVELGFRLFDSNGFKGGCAYTTDRFIGQLNLPNELKLGVMINASEIVNHKEGVTDALTQLFKPAAQSPLTLVRIACHMHEFENVLIGCTWLKEMGYEVGINLMQISDRSKDEIETVAHLASKNPIDVLYFADSMGSMNPDKTSDIITALRCGWSGPLGIHTHDNMGQALANSLRAVTDGVTWVDGTITGMGRGPGNVKTEYLAIELAEHRQVSLNITPLLSVIAKHFKPLQNKYGWGTNTYYYLAGKYGIHPSFVQEMLSDSRYDDEDLLAVIEHLRGAGGKKFSVHTLESGRHFYKGKPTGDWSPTDLVKDKEVLVIGAGPSAGNHCQALEDYISTSKPFVIALNTQITVKEDLIDIRAASHPVRLLADCPTHLTLPQPLATPSSMLPKSLRDSLKGKELLDFGISIETDTFYFGETHCILPTSLVIAYALAIAASGKASRILLAGFDGYSADDPRSAEMDKLLTGYQQTDGVPTLLAITPSRYKLPSTSVYSMI